MWPDRLMKQIQFLYDNPHIDVVGGKMKIIDENDKILGAWFSQAMKHNELKLKVAFVNYIPNSTATVRLREEYKHLIYNEIVSFEDYYLWLRLMYEHDMIFEIMDEYFANYRIHTP